MKPYFLFALTVIACQPAVTDTPRMLGLSADSLFQAYAADTAHLCLERDTEFLFNYPYVRPIRLPDAWKDDSLLQSLADIYNLMAFHNAIQTDLDAIARYEDPALASQACFLSMDTLFIADPSARALAHRMAALSDTYVHHPDLFVGDTCRSAALDEWFDTQYYALAQDIRHYLFDGNTHIDDDLTYVDFERRFSPAIWVRDCYTTYTDSEASPTPSQLVGLLRRMLCEQNTDAKAAQLFTLAGSPLDVSDAMVVIGEMERLLASGTFSPILHLVWRAYRVLYNRLYTGISTWSYSYNLRYNHYRRLVVLTYMNYLSAHPDDTMIYMVLFETITTDDILRLGAFAYGNESTTEMVNLYWNHEVI